jgi:DNA modification methylase
MISLHNADCIEFMKTLPDNSVDLILCDLPYEQTNEKWDIKVHFEDLWMQYKRVCKSQGTILLFGQEPFSSLVRMSNFNNYKYDYYWEKERATNVMQVKRRAGKVVETISVFHNDKKGGQIYNPQMIKYDGTPRSNGNGGKLGELIAGENKQGKGYVDTGWRYPTQVLRFKRDCLRSRLHPTQKPVALLDYLVLSHSNESDTVLDNCMGSGSTGIACINTNRSFIGCELDKGYFEIAQNRIGQVQQ